MAYKCQNCGLEMPYDVEWEDPPEGHEHIEVVRNPADEPTYLVEQRGYYCDVNCLIEAQK